MAYQYIITPSTLQSGASGIYVLETGVTVDGTGENFVFHRAGSPGITVQIDGIAREDDPGHHTIFLSASGHSHVTIGDTGEVHNGDSHAVFLSGGYNTLTNHGTISGPFTPVFLADSVNFVLNTGRILDLGDGSISTHGIHLGSGAASDGGQVVNEGLVQSDRNGVNLNSVGASLFNSGKIKAGDGGVLARQDDSSIFNAGLIKAGGTGIEFFDTAGYVENSGRIIAEFDAIYSAATSTIVNSGLIRSKTGSAIWSDGEMMLINSGKIVGDVIFTLGDDSYFAKGAGSVEGAVYGDQGDDSLKGAQVGDEFYGGGGTDRMDGRAGRDMLVGGTETDYLAGGRDNDTLYGDNLDGLGGSTDYFQFFERNVGTDRIKDFENGVDVIQLDGFRLDGTLADLLAGALGQNGAGDAVVRLGKLGDYKGKIVFEGVTMAEIDASDFQVLL